MNPPPTRRAIRSAGLGGHARVGTPKIAGYGGSHWLARFWGALAGTTAGAIIPGPAGVSEWKRLAGDLWGESGRGGFGDNQTSFSFRFQTPLSHVSPTAGLRLGGPEERLHRKDRCLGDQRLEQRSDPRPSTPASMRAGGRPSRTVCGPSHGLSPTMDPHRREMAGSRWFRSWRGGVRGACRSGLRPDPGQVAAVRRYSRRQPGVSCW